MANTQTTVPTFVDGQVLYGAQLNQSAGTGVPVFATTVTRDAGFGGAGEKTLAEGQLCYLESTNVVQYYDGAAWATLAPAPAVSSGLAFITSGTFSAVSQGTVTGCFSSAYTNYRIMLDFSVADGDTYFIFGTSGTISSSATLRHNTIYSSNDGVGGTTLGNTGNKNVIYWRIARTVTLNSNIILDVFEPNVATPVHFNSSYGGSSSTQAANGVSGGNDTSSNQYTDFTIRSDGHPSGSISFTYKIYGYANS